MQIHIRNKVFIQVNTVSLCMVVLNSSGVSTVGPSGACASLTFSGIAKPSQMLCVKDQDTLIEQSNILLKRSAIQVVPHQLTKSGYATA